MSCNHTGANHGAWVRVLLFYSGAVWWCTSVILAPEAEAGRFRGGAQLESHTETLSQNLKIDKNDNIIKMVWPVST